MIIYSSSPWLPKSLASGETSGGGPSTFMRYLGDYLRSQGHQTTNDPNEVCDIHFACLMGHRRLVKSLRDRTPIIHRLDGVSSAQNLSPLWRRYVQSMMALNMLTTRSIYISQHCHDAWAAVSGGQMRGHYNIIHNGAVRDTFSPNEGYFVNSDKYSILLCEHFRRKQCGLQVALEAFRLVKERLPKSKLVLAGQLSGEVPVMVKSIISAFSSDVQNAISIRGRISHAELPDLIHASDLFVHPVPNSACSHTVPEALACGVPAICYSGTGPAEFIGESGLVVQSEYEGVHDGFRRFPKEDPQRLAEAIITVLQNREEYRMKARARAHLFDSDITSARYLDVFQNALRTPPEPMSAAKALWLVGCLKMALGFEMVLSKTESKVKTLRPRRSCSAVRSVSGK